MVIYINLSFFLWFGRKVFMVRILLDISSCPFLLDFVNVHDYDQLCLDHSECTMIPIT